MKEIRRMPKAKDNEIVVGSELGTRSPDGVPLYRVIKVAGDVVTTVDIFRGPVDADQEPFEWSPGYWQRGIAREPRLLRSQSPAAVGDLVCSGTLVYEVISYDPRTDVTVIQYVGMVGYDGELTRTSGTWQPTYRYTRKNWESCLKPFALPLPADGTYIKVTEIAGWDNNPGCKVGDVVKVQHACGGDADGAWKAPMILDHEKGCAAVMRWEKAEAPAVVFVPKKGDKVKITALKRKPGYTLNTIKDAWHQLGPNARELLADIAERLVIGKAHGDFEKALNWTREAYEEDLDGIVYRAMKLRSAA
jgi:hypothetical protein